MLLIITRRVEKLEAGLTFCDLVPDASENCDLGSFQAPPIEALSEATCQWFRIEYVVTNADLRKSATILASVGVVVPFFGSLHRFRFRDDLLLPRAWRCLYVSRFLDPLDTTPLSTRAK